MRKKTIALIALALAAAALSSCSDVTEKRERMAYSGKKAPAALPGVSFTRVPATAFTFNETPEGRLVEGAENAFETIQPAFWISEKPVSPALYEAYMGKGKYPKNGLSYENAQKLLNKIYSSTNIPVILPTEAMLEAAMATGAVTLSKSLDYPVREAWAPSKETAPLRIRWNSRPEGSWVVSRKQYAREPLETYRSRRTNRFFIALQTAEEVPEETINLFNTGYAGKAEPSDGKGESFNVGGAEFTMVPVEGGRMTLGATEEQGKYAEEDEAPLHESTIAPFKIGSTEVTLELWEAVMGNIPVGNFKAYPKRPVVNVSWYDAQEFILRLRELTGRPFRLPSEDEWEFAARGGAKSKGFIFSGSKNAADVAVCTYKDKSGESVRPKAADVGSKKPNELGLYDMSGNAWEWVRGEHPDGGCIQRGGSRLSLNVACRVSNRQSMSPWAKKDTFGFRLAL